MTQEYREIRRYNINSFFLIDVVLRGGVRLRDAPNERLRRIPKSSTKVLAHLPTFTVSPNSMLFIVIKSSLLVYKIVWGEGGSLLFGFIFKIPCQRIFVQSDPGVPRTFVVD